MPMHANPSKVMMNRRIFWYHRRPERFWGCWGCCEISIMGTVSFWFAKAQNGLAGFIRKTKLIAGGTGETPSSNYCIISENALWFWG